EPIVAARKPFKLTVAANVLEHGTGALNIDACRIEGEPTPVNRLEEWSGFGQKVRPTYSQTMNTKGRWPANVILDEHMAGALDEQSGVLKSGARTPTGGEQKGDVYGLGHKTSGTNTFASSEGGASRFFYIARKDNECPSGQSSSTVSTAEMSSSGEGQPPASAPNGAATSERHDTGKQTDSPSTSETQ